MELTQKVEEQGAAPAGRAKRQITKLAEDAEIGRPRRGVNKAAVIRV
jgi:hypothetical protein